MKANSFSFPLQNLLHIHYDNGGTLSVCLDENSGRGIWREKIDSVFAVKHTGIYIGTDINTNQPIVVHNHYEFGSAYITNLSDFAKNKQIFWISGGCENSPKQVIVKALNHVLSTEKYKPKSYNCQTLVNSACNNKRVSRDASRILSYAAVFVVGVMFWLASRRT